MGKATEAGIDVSKDVLDVAVMLSRAHPGMLRTDTDFLPEKFHATASKQA